jgi:hypothetical protein
MPSSNHQHQDAQPDISFQVMTYRPRLPPHRCICATNQDIKPCSRTGSPRHDECPAVPAKRHTEGTAERQTRALPGLSA